ncbi:MAG: TolB-like protein [Rhodothermales bacterium]|jgi:TolB-like protein
MSFFNELKRRNVFRVGIAYGVASWLLLQVADLVFPRIGVEDSVITIMIAVLGIGFIPALAIAWAFEMTPEGLKRESEVDRSGSVAHQAAKKLDYITLAALAGVVLLVFLNKQPASPPVSELAEQVVAETASEPAPETDRRSVAVLPFDFRSSNPEDEFFAEGMHDDLLTQLAKIGSLKVISRTSVMEYKDTIKKIPEIAKELGVATIVEGGVQRSGSRIRINAQLIDAQTDEHLWAETYNRELTAENLFEIQAEISRSIAKALQATLSPAEEAQIGRVLTSNLEAWESYQRALRLRLSQNVNAIDSGLAEIDHAMDLDPGFAAAKGLKATLLLQKFWFYDPDPIHRDQALDLIEQGRALAPGLPELDLAEGFYHYWGYLDYDKALVALDRASKALPNNSRVFQAIAYANRRQGNWAESVSAFRRAIELSPRDGRNLGDLADTFSGLGRYTEADRYFEEGNILSPDAHNQTTLWANHIWMSTGDTAAARRFYNLTPYAFAQSAMSYWDVALSDRDFETAKSLVDGWPDHMLNVRVFNVTREVLRGVTLVLAGEAGQGRELLAGEEPSFEALVQANPKDVNAVATLCRIKGGLGKLDESRRHCNAVLDILPQDEFYSWHYFLYAAMGLADAGDGDGAVKVLTDMLARDASPSVYPIMQHPSFDGLRERPDYLALIEKYRHRVD